MSSKTNNRFIHCLLIFFVGSAFLGVGLVPMTIMCYIIVAGYWYYGKSRQNNRKPDDSPYCEEQRQAYMDEALLTTVENGGTIEEAEIAAEAIGKLYDKKTGR